MGHASPRPYDGQDLGSRPHVAVIFSDQIGDFVVSTPLLRGLRERYPGIVLDYLGGEKTRPLEEASPLIDARFSLIGPPDSLAELPNFVAERVAIAGPYDLAICLEAHPRAAAAWRALEPRFVVAADLHANGHVDRLWADVWNRPGLRQDYPELGSQYIGEIFCRLARVETEYTRPSVPTAPTPIEVPDVLVATGTRGSRSARLWPASYWGQLIASLHAAGWQTGLLGAPPGAVEPIDEAVLAAGTTDLRGRFTLPEVAGAMQGARLVVSVDNGLMHLGVAAGARTVALFGASPRLIWTPPVDYLTILDPSQPCTRCEENRFRNPDCLLPVHQCMLSVEPERVLVTVLDALRH
jgi:heptosyltransferase III